MIPDLLLEQILIGEKKKEDYYKDYGKTELENALFKLRKSNEEIENKYSFEEILLKQKVKKYTKSKNFFSYKIISFAVAAVLAVCVSIPQIVRNNKVIIQEQEQTRVKGKLVKSGYLKLYKMNGTEITELKNGEQVSEGDLIQLAYVPGDNNYGFIFSVDGNGNITRHFPEHSWNAEELKKSASDVPLAFSYELDDAPDFEYFVFVTSSNEFNLQEISKFGKNNCTLKYLQKGSFLPKNCKETIFILNK